MPKVTSMIHTPTETTLDVDAISFNCIDGKKHERKIYTASYDDVVLRKTSHYRVTFECPRCSASNTALLSNLLKKLGKNNAGCTACTLSPVNPCRAKVSKHLPKDKAELVELLPYTSLNAQVEALGNDFDYHPCFGSEKHSEPVVQSKQTGQVIHLANCDGMCQCCTAYFRIKTLKVRRDEQKRPLLVCAECSQTWENKPKLHNGIAYMTKFEHKFVKYCEKHGIPLHNGTQIGHKRVAFYIPPLNTYVDVKSNVGWWERKRVGHLTAPLHLHDVIENELNAKYMIIYPRTYVAVTRGLQKSLEHFHNDDNSNGCKH